MARRRPKNADIVESDRYHEFVPGKTLLHLDKDCWNGLGLNVYEFFGDNEGISAPGTEDYLLAITTAGYVTGNWSVENSKWTKKKLLPGHSLLVQKETSNAWQWRADGLSFSGWQVVNLIIDHNLINTITEQTFGANSVSLEIPSDAGFEDPFIYQLSLELKAEAEQQTPFGQLYGETAARLLAVHLLSKYSNIQRKPVECQRGLPKRKLQQVTDYIQDNLDKEISLDALAILTGLSTYHFMRLFKQSTGLAPHQYLVECRINKAKELLKHANWSVGRIAQKLGYNSQSHFATLFKRRVGVTPLVFRKGL